MRHPLNKLDINPWAQDTLLRNLFITINKQKASSRLVGGCVRDHLLGRRSQDIDIATQETPPNVISLLNKAGIKTIPSGLEHGTVTAVINKKSFHITTLRRDFQTDGRHATVEFTKDWNEDAARRDFTFNAMSADLDGTLYDYFNGYQDLLVKKIRFIGCADDRILEDHLRILRYFRMMATLNVTPGNKNDLSSCIKHSDKLIKLSRERIRSEFFKILSSNLCNGARTLMHKHGILSAILPQAKSPEIFFELIKIEAEIVKLHSINPKPIRRLASIIKTDIDYPGDIVASLRLSNVETKQLSNVIKARSIVRENMSETDIISSVYEFGYETILDATLVNWATQRVQQKNQSSKKSVNWMKIISIAQNLKNNIPQLPITGQDIIDIGVIPGPTVSQLKSKVETWWLKNGCSANRIQCLKKLRSLIKG